MRRPYFCGWAMMLWAAAVSSACAVKSPQPQPAVTPPPPARPVPGPEPGARAAAARLPDVFSCENMCARNRQCADVIAGVIADGFSDDMKRITAQHIKKSAMGPKCVEVCRKGMKSTDPAEQRGNKWMQRCATMPGCKAYAECIHQMLLSPDPPP